jgi:peptide/nickel transport system substrate-binding protein
MMGGSPGHPTSGRPPTDELVPTDEVKMRFRLGAARAGLLVVAGALVLAGCSAGTVTAPSTAPSATAASGLPQTGWQVATRSELADGGTLTLPVDAIPANFQLSSADSGYVDDQVIAGLYLPSFIQFDADGGWRADPDYATSVALRSTAPQVVEVKINPAAVWSDGSPITYRDVAANWHALNGSDPAFAPLSTNVWEDVTGVERGADDRDVLISFGKTNADWPAALGAIYPTWAVDTAAHFNTAWATGPFAADGTSYVSGGPFVVTKVDAAAGVLTFGRNPRWWGAPAKLDTVVFRAVSRESQGQSFANSELDLIDLHGSADTYATAGSRSDARVERSLGTIYRQLTLNGTSTVFADERVRRAFATALDRPVLARAILGQVGSPVQLLDNLIFLPGQKGYVDHLSTALTGRAADAKKLLTQAGYDTSGPVATKDGKDLAVRFVIPAENSASASIAQLVQQQAAVAGFKVTIDAVPASDFFDRYISVTDRNFDVTYFAWQGSTFPISATKAKFYPADSGQNYPGVSDPSLGAMWDKANAELDPSTRIDLANAIDVKITGLFTMIPLFVEPNAWGVSSRLANYGPAQFQSVKWADVGFLR